MKKLIIQLSITMKVTIVGRDFREIVSKPV